MKEICLIIVVFCSISLTTQDTLLFKSRKTKIVKIIEVNDSIGLIVFIENEDTTVVGKESIQSFSTTSKLNNTTTEKTFFPNQQSFGRVSQLGIQSAFNLIYRFGGELKE